MFENHEKLKEVDRSYFLKNYTLDEGPNWEKTVYKNATIETYYDSQQGFVLLITFLDKSYTDNFWSFSAENPEIWAINYIDEAIKKGKTPYLAKVPLHKIGETMNYGIYIGGFFIVWSIMLYDEMGIAPLICATAITIAGIICEHWGPNTNDDE